jgi:hypothetical protein
MNGFHIKEVYDEMDLRGIIAQADFLRKEAKKHHLEHGECVVYTNKKLTRFRLVLRINEATFMCIPEIDNTKLSVYLNVSEQLARLAGREAKIKLETIQTIIRERIQKRTMREQGLLKKVSITV